MGQRRVPEDIHDTRSGSCSTGRNTNHRAPNFDLLPRARDGTRGESPLPELAIFAFIDSTENMSQQCSQPWAESVVWQVWLMPRQLRQSHIACVRQDDYVDSQHRIGFVAIADTSNTLHSATRPIGESTKYPEEFTRSRSV